MASNAEQALQSHPFFSDFPADELDQIEEISGLVEYAEGEQIARSDQPADRFILVRQGDVVIEVESQEGDQLPVQKLSSGNVIGWSWLIPPHNWEFDTRAHTDVTAVEIDGAQLRQLCEQNSDLSDRIKSQLIDVLGERVSSIRYLLINVQQTTEDFQALTGG